MIKVFPTGLIVSSSPKNFVIDLIVATQPFILLAHLYALCLCISHLRSFAQSKDLELYIYPLFFQRLSLICTNEFCSLILHYSLLAIVYELRYTDWEGLPESLIIFSKQATCFVWAFSASFPSACLLTEYCITIVRRSLNTLCPLIRFYFHSWQGDEQGFDQIFLHSNFKTYTFRIRAKMETYNVRSV